MLIQRATIPTLLLLVLLTADLASADVILDANNRLSSITNLNIGGVNYTASMHYHILTWDEFVALPLTPITFTTQTDALAATNAIQAAVLADASIAVLSGTDDLSLPFRDLGFDFPATHYVEAVTMMHSAAVPYASFPENGISIGRVSGRSDNDGWIAFTAVPEPNSFSLIAIGLVGSLACRRRPRSPDLFLK